MQILTLQSENSRWAKEIMNRFGMSETVFYTFVHLGMPIRKINARLCGHVEKLNQFLKAVTVGEDIIASIKSL